MFYLTCSERAFCCLPALPLILFLGQPRPPPQVRDWRRCSGQLQILDTRLQRQWPVLLCRTGRRQTKGSDSVSYTVCLPHRSFCEPRRYGISPNQKASNELFIRSFNLCPLIQLFQYYLSENSITTPRLKDGWQTDTPTFPSNGSHKL